MPRMNLETWTTRELLELDGMDDALEEAGIDRAEMPEGELREVLLAFASGDDSPADDADDEGDDDGQF